MAVWLLAKSSECSLDCLWVSLSSYVYAPRLSTREDPSGMLVLDLDFSCPSDKDALLRRSGFRAYRPISPSMGSSFTTGELHGATHIAIAAVFGAHFSVRMGLA